jgi:hypothetical protein
VADFITAFANASTSAFPGSTTSGNPPGFTASNLPLTNGQNAATPDPINVPAVQARNLISWFVPERGVVQMFINPDNIKYDDKKIISKERTRNGFLLQYWGEELKTLNISGSTGSSGIEGINVLHDIYRNEQLSLDPLALYYTAFKQQQQSLATSTLGLSNIIGGATSLLQTESSSLFQQANNLIATGSSNPQRQRPSLGSMAFTVEMYWSGWVFRGFFENFSITERANMLGLFDYNFIFTVTQQRGIRYNFLPWHRAATYGPSDNDPRFGNPYSFGRPVNPNPRSFTNTSTVSTITPTLDRLLTSDRGIL